MGHVSVSTGQGRKMFGFIVVINNLMSKSMKDLHWTCWALLGSDGGISFALRLILQMSSSALRTTYGGSHM